METHKIGSTFPGAAPQREASFLLGVNDIMITRRHNFRHREKCGGSVLEHQSRK